MVKENKNKEKLCLFFASDYHFEMISLPYINENLKKDNDVIIMTENDLNSTVEKLLSSVNLEEDEKNKITKLDWNNNDVNKFRKIKNINKKTIIFIKGKENYIKNVNENIKSIVNNSEIQVIDCYDINEVSNEVSNITKKYNNVLSTSGIEKLI